MSINSQLILILSALGAINGFILALYLWQLKERKLANRFLAAMLVMVSVRTFKSVLFYFNPDVSKFILQVGLSSCFLIGPMLYFFTLAYLNKLKAESHGWKVHLVTLISIIIIVGLFYPYSEYRDIWGGVFYRTINYVWLGYLIFSGVLLYPVIKVAVGDKKLSRDDIWLFSVFSGNTIIWLAYYTASYTSYIVGALSFSFVLLMGVLAFIYRKPESNQPAKYANQKIEAKEANETIIKLQSLMVEQELYLDPMVSMPKVAKRMTMSTPKFSQLLNDNLNKSFSTFINEYRVNHAKRLLKQKQPDSIEEIASKCGFNSLSTFYTAFKKVTGLTPAKFKGISESSLPNL